MRKGFSAYDLEILLKRVSKIEGLISFFDSRPGEDIIPREELKEITLEVLEEYSPELHRYGSPVGFESLRRAIAEFFFKDAAVKDNLLITSGAQQGLDLVLRVLAKKRGKKLSIAIEDPSYIGFRHLADNLKAEILEIPVRNDGFDVDLFQKKLQKKSIDVLYITPDFHNPTGATLSLKKKKKLIEVARERGIYIIEDLVYRWLGLDDLSNLSLPILSQKYDKGFVVGSFSKILSPGFRIGWIFTHRIFVDQLMLEKRATELFQPYLTQIIVYEFIRKGLLKKHLKRSRKIYRVKRDFTEYLLKRWLSSEYSWKKPKGNFYFWIHCPTMDSSKLLNRAIRYKVIFGAGKFFSRNKAASQFFRLSFSSLTLSQIEEGLRRLRKAIGLPKIKEDWEFFIKKFKFYINYKIALSGLV